MLECYKACPYNQHDDQFTRYWCGYSGSVEDLLEDLPVAWWYAYLDCPWLGGVA